MIGNMWEWTLDGFVDPLIDGVDNDRDGQVDEAGERLVPSASGHPFSSLPAFWTLDAEYSARGSSMANPMQAVTTGRLGRTADWFWNQQSVDFGFRCAWPAD